MARELAAHFQDGIEAGAAAHELAWSFGDARRVAKLIRRAKTRNRPVAWKATRLVTRSLLAVFALLLVTCVGLTVRLYSGEPTLSRNYLAELNAPVQAVPEEERAWPLYQEAFLATGEFPRYDKLDPSDENWAALTAFAERNTEAVRLYWAAGRKPRLGRVHHAGGDPESDELSWRHKDKPADFEPATPVPAEENPPFISVLLPELSPLREGSALLVVDAHVAALAGDAERAYEDIETTFRIAEHVSEMPFLISDLVAVAILHRNTDLIGRLLRDRPELFSDEQLVELSHRLAGIRGGGVLRLRLSAERWMFEDLVQRLYSDDRRGDGHLAAESPELLASLSVADWTLFDELMKGPAKLLFVPAMSAFVADRREMLRKHDELMTAFEAEAQVPLWERDESEVEGELMRMHDSPIDHLRYLPLVIMMPSLSRASVIAERGTQERDATLAALACELYRRRTGHWPASLAELAPRYLPAVPLDRFDGQPLRYRVADGCGVIYSIGVDRDDDGGRVPEGAHGNRRAGQWQPERVVEGLKAAGSPELPDGDWVLWPPVE
ncbi:MAG: hypothetical protein AMS25_17800 [Gemmatimonas sp. SM23_52]|nr:MAG: hypothetical protein AMS25_17800 [Gemmatimonas sp. SM23_52]